MVARAIITSVFEKEKEKFIVIGQKYRIKQIEPHRLKSEKNVIRQLHGRSNRNERKNSSI